MTQEQLPSSIREVMERMPQAFQPDNALGVNTTIQYKFTGDEPGNWVLKVADGKCTVEEREADSATITINSPSDVWLKIIRREQHGGSALANGQFTYTGDLGVLTQMGRWFGSLTGEGPMLSSIRDGMKLMPQAFQPEKAPGVNATIQYQFTGEEAGSWHMKIADGKCTVEEGEADAPTLTINSPSDIWLKIISRELDGATAFMSGQFTYAGDMAVLMQMQTWFGQA